MTVYQATAIAHPNIALIKYWGNLDQNLRIPASGSISLTLDGLTTKTQVEFIEGLSADRVTVNGTEAPVDRVGTQLELIRERADIGLAAIVSSESDFPHSAGLASSAAAFAALSLAAAQAAGLELPPRELSILARRGSGSAARSIFGGYVELHAGSTDEDCYAEPLEPADHWDLIDLIAMVSSSAKQVGSSLGHAYADSSPLQQSRLTDAPRRLQECRAAIATKDFSRLAQIVELDSDMMHAVMMTSQPALHYWTPQTIEVMAEVRSLRQQGVATCYTVDAGPNVHCLCLPEAEQAVRTALEGLTKFTRATPGCGARLV